MDSPLISQCYTIALSYWIGDSDRDNKFECNTYFGRGNLKNKSLEEKKGKLKNKSLKEKKRKIEK